MMNTLLHMFFFICFVTGLYTIIKDVIYPVFDAVMYAVGYTVFNVKRINWAAGKRKPLDIMKFIIRCFADGVDIWLCESPNVEAVSGDIHWKPYFHYWRD
jgi:hypothetical protein